MQNTGDPWKFVAYEVLVVQLFPALEWLRKKGYRAEEEAIRAIIPPNISNGSYWPVWDREGFSKEARKGLGLIKGRFSPKRDLVFYAFW